MTNAVMKVETVEHALALISNAERALEQAVTLQEALTIRSAAKAAEAASIALNLGECAQRAKVLQLKAERKAGSWLSQHIQPGKPSQDARVRLGDLELDYSQSSRWQTLARIPDEKFNSYLDEHISRGWEVTAGGLRAYARNLYPNGHGDVKMTVNFRRGAWLVPPDGVCALAGFAVPCHGPMTGQHILNKSKARGNEEVRSILAACPPEVMARVCEAHNVDRWADTVDARRILLLQNIYRYGWSRMKAFFDGLPWKVPQPDLTLEGMLG